MQSQQKVLSIAWCNPKAKQSKKGFYTIIDFSLAMHMGHLNHSTISENSLGHSSLSSLSESSRICLGYFLGHPQSARCEERRCTHHLWRLGKPPGGIVLAGKGQPQRCLPTPCPHLFLHLGRLSGVLFVWPQFPWKLPHSPAV